MIVTTDKRPRTRAWRPWAAGLATLVLVAAAGHAFAQEHPREHPKEHPKEQAKPTAALNMDAFANAVEAWVKRDTQLRGGYFVVYDPVDKKPLLLTLDKVHREKLARTGDQVYFACADFKTPEGTVYDLDVFMKGTSEADLVPTEINVHKLTGKPRYNWYEEGGIWKKKPADK
jgi:hypothetical protein